AARAAGRHHHGRHRRTVLPVAAAEGAMIARRQLLALILAAAAACGRPAPSEPAAPTEARVISLVPAATEMLFAIGAGADMVAVSSFDRYPPEVERLPRVGARSEE